MTDFHDSLDAALERTAAPRDELAAQIVHRLTCLRCRMGWTCGGLSEDDFGEATRIADLLAAVRVGVLAPIRAFHDQWGFTDADDVDQLALWEDLGALLSGGAR